MSIDVTVNTVPLERIASSMPSKLKTLLDETRLIMLEEMRARVPVLTGHLRDSIDILLDGYEVLITVGAPYASLVNYGSRFRAAHPFFEPAFDKGWAYLSSRLPTLMEA
jgi:HK97 gp10 family phage protein